MDIIKNDRQALKEERRKNRRLKIALDKAMEMIEFLGVLNDVDIEDLFEEETDDDEQ